MKYFLLFIIYSFLGWFIEEIRFLTMDKKLVNRGFLIGPYCPIYGFGCLLIITLLNSCLDNPFILFIMSMNICGVLEYLTSYLMKKIFKARWWDYKDNKFNINGRICLETLVLFGLGGLFIMYILNPIINNFIDTIPLLIQNIIGIIIFIIFIADTIISFYIINDIKKMSLTIKGDSTEKISSYVKNKLHEKSIWYRRIEEAFPNLTLDKDKIEAYVKKLDQKIQKQKDKLKEKTNKKLTKIKKQ